MRIDKRLSELLSGMFLTRQQFFNRINQLERKIMASIQELETKVTEAVNAIADLAQATKQEKQEVVTKLGSLEATISEQSALIEQLRQQGSVPDALIQALSNAVDQAKQAGADIKNIVETPTPVAPSTSDAITQSGAEVP